MSSAKKNRQVTGMRQLTLAGSIAVKGIGVHTGEPAHAILHPADVNTGILFQRTDLASEADLEIPALWDRVSATELCTAIGDPTKASATTIEHLMAALAGLGVDNAIIELDRPEIPILDGSSVEWIEALDQVGLVEQAAPRRFIRVLRPVSVSQGDSTAELVPFDGQRFDVTIDFPTAVIGRQAMVFDLSEQGFRQEVARARTFGSIQDAEKLWAMGFALGSSLDNSVAIDGDKVVNPEGTRWSDEFVRHKLLDAIGDLALAGDPILGCFRSFKGGHRLNNNILHALFADERNWALETAEPAEKASGHAELLEGLAVPALAPDVK